MASEEDRERGAPGGGQTPSGMTAHGALGLPRQSALPLGSLAFGAALASMVTCYGSIVLSNFLATDTPLVINPDVQAVLMWGFGVVAIYGLWRDRARHGSSIPLAIGITAVAVLLATLYVDYDTRVETLAYVLLVIAALLNWVVFLGILNRRIQDQAREIESLNRGLERKVEHQDDQIGRLDRLRQFLPPQVAEMVVSDDTNALLATHRRYVACLFCDIRQFTAVSEAIEPEEVMAILQAYHDRIGELVVAHNGTIGYRAGDGLMVFFNDPLPCEDPVLQAARLAVAARDAFEEIRAPWVRLGHPIGLGLGIASGYATLGLVGLQGRSDYTAIGSVINIAARLCDRAEDGQILLSQRAYGDVEGRVRCEPVGALELKGVRNPVETCALVALEGNDGGA